MGLLEIAKAAIFSQQKESLIQHKHLISPQQFSQRLGGFNMSDKLCLQWNDFQENIKNAFGNLRDNSDFTDVTLASEDV